ncbi:MAG: S46 family peptidase [Acidobacteria bacterium]|nr:S46 family peptidase [Acidobacteriota bacterium]
MKKRIIWLTILMILIAIPALRADEGMWTFDNPPLRQWKEKYGFEPSQAWLDHIRLSTVRLSEGAGGGTGVFVSPDGLIMTNQHVGRGQVSKLSTGGRDLVHDGFYAPAREQELKCPDLEVNVLIAYRNVTDRVQAAGRKGADDKQSGAMRQAEIAAIEKEAAGPADLKAEVVTLYNGGEYWLYTFKRYTDIRLVFSPEEQIAYYGGDYDNFTYPRYCLDITFFRVYENGAPARIEHYLEWSANGASEGDLVIVPGFPGTTQRLLTVSQLKYQRDIANPLQMQVWTSRRDVLKRYAEQGAEQARQASPGRLSLENSIKRLVGQQAGLENPRIFAKKEEQEAAMLRAIAANPAWQREYGGAWRQIDDAYSQLPGRAKQIAYASLTASRLGTMASNFIRYAAQSALPNEKRYEEFRDNRMAAMKLSLLSTAPVYTAMEEAILAGWLEEAQKALGAQDPFVRAALAGSTPREAAGKAISGTKLHDPAFRKDLFERGPSAINQSRDPLLELARRVEPVIAELRQWQEEAIRNVETRANEQIARARFGVYGKNLYPDANFNLRIEYGTVSGYEEDTTLVPFRTTFYGLFDRATGFNQKPPYQLPERYRKLTAEQGQKRLDLSTPFNFVYTADTIGGNSGSPVINRNAELVGINFDSNIQKLPNRYLYIDENEGARAVGVHSAGILEALDKIYGADALIREIRRK